MCKNGHSVKKTENLHQVLKSGHVLAITIILLTQAIEKKSLFFSMTQAYIMFWDLYMAAQHMLFGLLSEVVLKSFISGENRLAAACTVCKIE